MAVEYFVRKGEIACNKQFLLFSQCFLPCIALIFHTKCILKCCLQFVSIWTSLKFCHLVMGYNKKKKSCTNGRRKKYFRKNLITKLYGKVERKGALVCYKHEQILSSKHFQFNATDKTEYWHSKSIRFLPNPKLKVLIRISSTRQF